MMVQIPTELAAKIATTFRGMPALLALLLVNVLFMGMVVWAIWTSAELRFKERSELIRIVDRCTVQQKSP
jgi:hypothetical protein